MVLEERLEDVSFSKLRTVPHGRFGLGFEYSFHVEVEAFQDEENFLGGFGRHGKFEQSLMRTWAILAGNVVFQMLSTVGFEDMSSCLPDTTARHSRRVGDIM